MERLTDQIVQGDRDALERLFKLMYPRLHAYACRFTEHEEDAEDIIQDAFLKMLEHTGEVRDAESYLFLCVRNGCLDYVKHREVVLERIMRMDDESLAEGLYQLDMMPDVEQDTLGNELRQQVETLVNLMPTRQKEVFLLSREHELMNKEIAEQLGISVKAVEKHITASLKFLREHLSEEYLVLLFLLQLPM